MATAFVNKHITRILAAGGTVAEPTWLATVDAWITSQTLYGNLFDWSNPAFGVIKNGSNEISKIMGMGTTWLPRLGDLTPVTPASTLYDATAIGGLPAWTNTSSSAWSYYGAARDGSIRMEPLRRKHHQGFTVVSVYKKNHANLSAMLGMGQLGGGISLVNSSGSPGSCVFSIGPNGSTAFTATHGTTLANNAVHIIGGTFDQDTLTPYVEGVAGTTSTGYISTNTNATGKQYRPLLGGANTNGQVYYMFLSGAKDAKYGWTITDTVPTFNNGTGVTNNADMTISDLIMFDTALTPTQIASLNTLLRTRYGP